MFSYSDYCQNSTRNACIMGVIGDIHLLYSLRDVEEQSFGCVIVINIHAYEVYIYSGWVRYTNTLT